MLFGNGSRAVRIILALPIVLLTACSPPTTASKYAEGQIVYSCVGHIKGQVTGVSSISGYWVRFATVSMEQQHLNEAELCHTPTSMN